MAGQKLSINDWISWAFRGLLCYFCININSKMEKVDQLITDNVLLEYRLNEHSGLLTGLRKSIDDNSKKDDADHKEFRNKFDAISEKFNYSQFLKPQTHDQ